MPHPDFYILQVSTLIFCFLLLPQPLTVLYSSIFVLNQSSSFLNSNSISSSVFYWRFLRPGNFIFKLSPFFQFQILILYFIFQIPNSRFHYPQMHLFTFKSFQSGNFFSSKFNSTPHFHISASNPLF